MLKQEQLRFRVRWLLIGFIVGLVLSGLTAIPLRWEMNGLAKIMGATAQDTIQTTSGLLQWVVTVRNGLNDTYGAYPFIAYGTDWLAFGHIMIAIAFIGPLRDPIRNAWIVEWGMIACVLVIPTAFVFGPIREIPFYHQLIDCSFGVVGIFPLYLCRRYIKDLEALQKRVS